MLADNPYAARRSAFRKLHESGCFVLPNPWDIGTTRYLGSLGFSALATTSAGLAFSLGLPDARVSREAVLEHISAIVAATDLPVNADFESGFAREADGVAESVKQCVATGVAGLSIEDATGDLAHPLYELPRAVERLKAARTAIDSTGEAVMLVGRAECFLVGHPDPLNESIRRLEAYAAAGADVLYAPGVKTREQINMIVKAVHPKPVNVLMSTNTGLRVADLAEVGVRRVSVGSTLARVAWTAFIHASKLIANEGSFAGFDGLIAHPELNAFFRKQGRP